MLALSSHDCYLTIQEGRINAISIIDANVGLNLPILGNKYQLNYSQSYASVGF